MTTQNMTLKDIGMDVWVFILLCLIFVLARYGLLQSSIQMLVWFDSATNADIARQSVFSPEFWLGISPPAYPYLMKFFLLGPLDYAPMACCQSPLPGLEVVPVKPLPLMQMELAQFVTDNYNIAGLMMVQWLISVACWIALSRAVFSRLQGRVLSLTGAFLVLLLGCELAVVIWDRNVLTESLTISVLVLLCTLLVQRWHLANPKKFVGFILVLIVFLNLRVVNFYLLAMIFAWIAVPMYRANERIRLAVLGAFVGLTFMTNNYILFESDRSITPIRSVVSTRIMSPGFEDIRGWFEEQGMPRVPEEVIGQFWYGPYADYPELNKWIHSDASRLYQKYLITHPWYFFTKPLQRHNHDNESLLNVFTPNLDWQTPKKHGGLALFFNDAIILLLIPAGALVLLRRRRDLPPSQDQWLMSLGIFLTVSGVLLAYINWHADLVEVNRHVAPFMLQVRVGLLLMVLGVLPARAK